MKIVRLAGTSIETSALGFGTAQLGPRLSRDLRSRLLEEAFDTGITLFDTSPVYGYGCAESSLGAFLRKRRDRVTITTKAGLELRSLALLRRAVGRTTMFGGRFDPHDVRLSLEQSLRRLRTDYVDIFVLHECQLEQVTDELLELMETLVREGKARATGTATSPEVSAAFIARGGQFPAVIQIPHSAFAVLPDHPDRAVITYAALSRGIGLDRALAENRDGALLFSTRRPERIADAVNAAFGVREPAAATPAR
jgi:D-threo-aldose 1-dehydrogenase